MKKRFEMTREVDLVFNTLYTKYGTLNLTKKQLSTELNISVRTIDKYICQSVGIPNYIKMNNGRVLFPIIDVRKFLTNTFKVV